jgi:hypothetical protein
MNSPSTANFSPKSDFNKALDDLSCALNEELGTIDIKKDIEQIKSAMSLKDKESIINALFLVQAGYISTRAFVDKIMKLHEDGIEQAIEDVASWRDISEI